MFFHQVAVQTGQTPWVQTGENVTFCDTCHLTIAQRRWFSSQIKSPFLNRRQPLKLFKFGNQQDLGLQLLIKDCFRHGVHFLFLHMMMSHFILLWIMICMTLDLNSQFQITNENLECNYWNNCRHTISHYFNRAVSKNLRTELYHVYIAGVFRDNGPTVLLRLGACSMYRHDM